MIKETVNMRQVHIWLTVVKKLGFFKTAKLLNFSMVQIFFSPEMRFSDDEIKYQYRSGDNAMARKNVALVSRFT